jgi:hypothetical protein
MFPEWNRLDSLALRQRAINPAYSPLRAGAALAHVDIAPDSVICEP